MLHQSWPHIAQKSVSDLEVFVVKRARGLTVERDLELLRPVQCRSGARHVVVPIAGAVNATGDIACMGSNLVGDASLLHVFGPRQANVPP